jgi:hypothetical protein
VKEFTSYINYYDIWSNDYAAHTIYKNVRWCLGRAARDLWEHNNVIDLEDEPRGNLIFQLSC